MPICGSGKGILGDLIPVFNEIPTYKWDASIKNSILKPDNNQVVNDGDQVNKWNSDGSAFFTKEPAVTNYPIYYGSRNSIRSGQNSSMFASKDLLSPLNSTFAMVYSYNELLTNSSNILLFWYGNKILNIGVSLQFYNGHYDMGTDTLNYTILPSYIPVINRKFVALYSYNSTTYEFKLVVDNCSIYKRSINYNTGFSAAGGQWNINGYWANGVSTNIDIYELQYYNTILSDDNMVALKLNLLAKWS